MVSSFSLSVLLASFLGSASWSAPPALAFQLLSPSEVVAPRSESRRGPRPAPPLAAHDRDDRPAAAEVTRRSAIAAAASSALLPALPGAAGAEESMYAPKFVQSYDDFTPTSEGWSYRDVKVGKGIGGGELKDGDRVVFDWSGYTIGYFGRPFEAKGGPQGGAFDKDLDYFRTVLGSGTLVPGLEGALRGMTIGGVRQVIVPYGPLSYPPDDAEHARVGPKPTTFSGMRALNFVLENPRVDRTLLFNVKLVRVDRSDGKGGFIRG